MAPYKWIIDNHNDTIQQHLINNTFFGLQELQYMSQFIDDNTIVLDIGANIGNHTVYFAKETKAKQVYCIEPIPRAYRMLLANIALNYCHNVNVDFIGIALGHMETIGYPYLNCGTNNLGSTTLSPIPITDSNIVTFDPVRIVSGDSLFSDLHFDFIKLDVEGMEMLVLQGLQDTIHRCRPKIFIEILDPNLDVFNTWIKSNNYQIIDKFDEPNTNFCNIMIIPQ
jgi:FkbM family methyltransferase